MRDYGVAGQLGREATPAEYVAALVAVFREVRRVLRPDATLWLNLGDMYASAPLGNKTVGVSAKSGLHGVNGASGVYRETLAAGHATKRDTSRAPGIKPKDLLMMPARVAIALQEDGWWLRSEITWCKLAPMPESVTDRPTSATEKIFLLTKSARYFYDAEAVKEEAVSDHPSGNGFKRDARLTYRDNDGARGGDSQWDKVGGSRNMRNFWLLGPEPFPNAHFATFVTEIPRRAILAGTSAKGCCAACGAPWVRVTEKAFVAQQNVSAERGVRGAGTQKPMDASNGWQGSRRGTTHTETTGWAASCECGADVVPCTILDPFGGAGTTGLVADRLGRNAILVELNPEYAAMAERRLRGDAGMFAEIAAD